MGDYAQLCSKKGQTTFLEIGINCNEAKQRKLLILNLCKHKPAGRFFMYIVKFNPDKINDIFLFNINGYAFA